MWAFIVAGVVIGVMVIPCVACAQRGSVVLTWEYPVSEERNISRFLLQQNTNGRGYVDTGWGIDRSVREFKVTGLKRKDTVCFKMVALLEQGDFSVRADESNEVCMRVSRDSSNDDSVKGNGKGKIKKER